MSMIGFGDINNLELSALSGIRTDASIQWQLNQLTNNYSTLSNLQDIDLSNFGNIQTSIENLESTTLEIQNTNTTINDNLTELNGNVITLNNFKTDQLLYNSTNDTTIQSKLDSSIYNDYKDTLDSYMLSNDGEKLNMNNSIYSKLNYK